jgi:hypothetical protein
MQHASSAAPGGLAARALRLATGDAALDQSLATKAWPDEFALKELEMVIEGILESLPLVHKEVVERILQTFRTKLGALL